MLQDDGEKSSSKADARDVKSWFKLVILKPPKPEARNPKQIRNPNSITRGSVSSRTAHALEWTQQNVRTACN